MPAEIRYLFNGNNWGKDAFAFKEPFDLGNKTPGHHQLFFDHEGLHTEFACLIYSHLDEKLPESRVVEIITNAVTIEQKFIFP